MERAKLKVPSAFYQRDTARVAREILGMRLVRIHRGRRLSGWITEVEAYLGEKDRACHTFGGRRTARTETMFREGGCAYIYLIYGMHHCLNFVTQNQDDPQAVLIRSIIPDEGISVMERLRQKKFSHPWVKGFTDGPGKLAQALALTKKHDGLSLVSDELFVERVPPNGLPPQLINTRIFKGPRIGVDYAGAHARWPLRFWLGAKK
jgi:DNA-3-methyladenine glycosylase